MRKLVVLLALVSLIGCDKDNIKPALTDPELLPQDTISLRNYDCRIVIDVENTYVYDSNCNFIYYEGYVYSKHDILKCIAVKKVDICLNEISKIEMSINRITPCD